MTLDFALGIAVSAVLAAYLLYALLFPDRF